MTKDEEREQIALMPTGRDPFSKYIDAEKARVQARERLLESVDVVVTKDTKRGYMLACSCGFIKKSDTNLDRQSPVPCGAEGCEGTMIWSYSQEVPV